jgi:RNA polymerase sigma-70 factor (ECF subfamily)
MTPHVPPTGGPERGTIERFRQHDPRAFEEIVDATSSAAYALARRICGNTGLAEDAMQNAFLDVWRRAATYDPAIAPVSSWVMCIVRNRSVDAVRRVAVHHRRRAHEEWLADAVAPDDVCEQVIRDDQARNVDAAMAVLSEVHRHVIELSYSAGLSQSEIAAQLRLPLGTVKSRVRLGLCQLRRHFDENEHVHLRDIDVASGDPARQRELEDATP